MPDMNFALNFISICGIAGIGFGIFMAWIKMILDIHKDELYELKKLNETGMRSCKNPVGIV